MEYRQYTEAAGYIKAHIGNEVPRIGIILGSGLGKLGDAIEDPVILPYSEIPGFPVSTAIGHKSRLIYGKLGGKTVIAMQGRFHFYEGYPMEKVTFPIRVMKLLGVEYLFASNAAGGMNPDFRIGDLMLISDHINLLPNPLIGPNMEEFGPRFPDMTRPYSPKLRKLAHEVADSLEVKLFDGVYIGCSGPSYETPAELKFFHKVGADAVGMSTIPEVIVARHCGIECLGISIITDLAFAGETDKEYVTDGEEIVKAADRAADTMTVLFENMIKSL